MLDHQRIKSSNETNVSSYLGSQNQILIPPFDHGLTLVTQSCDPGVTAITHPHTPVSPPTHTSLSKKQALVFAILEKNVSRQTSYNMIGAALGLSKSASRDAVMGLVSKKYISNIITVRDGVFQGFTYRIDSGKCQQFYEAGGVENKKYLDSNHTVTPSSHTVIPYSVPPHTSSSSVCSLEKKLTTKTIDLREPELLWWAEKGLTNRQVNSWLDEFQMNLEELSQSLRAARFDILINEIKVGGMPINEPINYFYKRVKMAGIYSRPPNYKSVFELRADEFKDQLRRDKIAKEEIWNAEIDAKLKTIMDDQKSSLYQELLGSIGEFGKDDPFIFEVSMRELIKERYPMDRDLP